MLSAQATRAVPLCSYSRSVGPRARLCKLVLRYKPTLELERRLSAHGLCRPGRALVCQAAASASATSSLPGPRRRQRHAMMNDYLVVIPFGIAVAVGGLLSLPLRGAWAGLAVALSGGMLFTVGSMSHDRTTAGQESKAPLTLAAAGIAAALSRVFYNRAVVGVFGTMAATIVSAAVSLFLVYNVVLGGNKPQQSSASPFSSAKSSKTKASNSAPVHTSPAEPAWWKDDSSTQTSKRHQDTLPDVEPEQSQGLHTAQAAGISLTQYPANVQAVAVVTGVVLYAQGIWGLWGETLGYSPASMTGALASGLLIIAAAQTLLGRQPNLNNRIEDEQ